MKPLNFKNKRVLVMGLGLHGGGTETARFLASRGAHVLCTDMKSSHELEPSLRALEHLPIRFVLGRHNPEDFDNADIIVKNPAVPANSPFLKGKENIETDISIFLKHCPSPLFAITGSKGKSTTATLLHHLLKKIIPPARLGGNITVNPLSFLETLEPHHPVVLELSSWQLADLRGRNILRPNVAIITNLMRDHQNHYSNFSDYEADKKVIFESIEPEAICIFPGDLRGREWARQCRGRVYFIQEADTTGLSDPRLSNAPPWHGGAFIDSENRVWLCPDAKSREAAQRQEATQSQRNLKELLSPHLPTPGRAFRMNAAFAALAFHLQVGQLQAEHLPDTANARNLPLSLKDAPTLPYRMEMFLEVHNIRFHDDTSATIPEATTAAVQSIKRPLVLIAGGEDKDLNFDVFTPFCRIPQHILMLAGTATDKWLPLLHKAGARVEGTFPGMMEAVEAALTHLSPGQDLLLSPGAASFGMFRHEFHRGDEFKKACRLLTADNHPK